MKKKQCGSSLDKQNQAASNYIQLIIEHISCAVKSVFILRWFGHKETAAWGFGEVPGQVNKTTDQNSAEGWISDCTAPFSPLHKMMQPGAAFLAYSACSSASLLFRLH